MILPRFFAYSVFRLRDAASISCVIPQDPSLALEIILQMRIVPDAWEDSYRMTKVKNLFAQMQTAA